MRTPSHHLVLLLALLPHIGGAADDPRIAARKLEREKAVQTAGIDRAMSKEMPDAVKALPVFGEIEWTVKDLPFIGKGPHAGISGAGMAVVDGKIYLAGGFIPAGDGTQDVGHRSSRWAHRYDPKTDQWTQLPDLPARRDIGVTLLSSMTRRRIVGHAWRTPSHPAVSSMIPASAS